MFDAGVEWGGGDQSGLVSALYVRGQAAVADVYVAKERDAGGSHVGFRGADEAGTGFRGRLP
ncbi:hypothetical protein OG806_48220 [Streptomyces sp. NBC_00882]|uniref:hypothetical protein n=1 Tax=Streptomyces TaxID=1883 RepID=UPI00386E5BD4|nr:hypothetical protein OG806_48220 [Streptomyces sp. NBC_00882]WSZ63569.1 hypothetical protein OH824_47060 [Streptomyces canus]